MQPNMNIFHLNLLAQLFSICLCTMRRADGEPTKSYTNEWLSKRRRENCHSVRMDKIICPKAKLQNRNFFFYYLAF